MSYTLLKADCEHIFPELRHDTIDLVISSPPYWNARKYIEDHTFGDEDNPYDYVNNLATYFDKFANYLTSTGNLIVNLANKHWSRKRFHSSEFDRRKFHDDYEKLPKIIKDKTLCKPKNIILFPSMFATNMQMRGWTLREFIVWFKPNGMPDNNHKNRMLKKYEMFMVFTLGGKNYYNYVEASVNKFVNDVIKVPVEHSKYHTAIFPQKLITPLLKIYSPPDALVCDPFSGSGTVAKCCLKTGRNFIGTELNEETYNRSSAELNELREALDND